MENVFKCSFSGFRICALLHFRYHTAITMTSSLAVLYLNGANVGSSPSVGLDFSKTFGTVADAWIGRGHITTDPYVNAYYRDYRVYGSALP